MDERERGSWALPLFVLGAVVGAAAGLLLAPDSGKENRRKLTGWLKDRKDKTKEQVLAKKEQVEAALEAGRKAFKEADRKPHIPA